MPWVLKANLRGPQGANSTDAAGNDDALTAFIKTAGTKTKTALDAAYARREPRALGKLYARLAARHTVPCNIIFAGSSTAGGVGATGEHEWLSTKVTRALQAAYPSGILAEDKAMRTVNTAYNTWSKLPGVHGYYHSQGGGTSATYGTDWMGYFNPAAIFHIIGSNDYYQQMPLETYKTNIRNAIIGINSKITGGLPCVHVLVQSFQRRDINPLPAIPWAAYGQALAELAAEDLDNRAFIDLSPAFTAANYNGTDPLALSYSDSIHTADGGYSLLSDELLRNLRIPGARAVKYAAADTFTRADAAALGTSETGQAWSGAFLIEAGKAKTTTGGNAWIETNSADVDVSAVITHDGVNTPGIFARSDGADANRIGLFYYGAGQFNLIMVNAGATTGPTNAYPAPPTVAGQEYVLRLVVKGAQVTGYLNGVPRLFYTLTAGEQTQLSQYTKAGLRLGAGGTAARFDNFSAIAI